jgi:hypothetical protein
VPERAIPHQNRVARVALNRRIREHFPKKPSIASFVARFLAQFAQARRNGIGVGFVHDAAWNLKFDCVRAVAKLLHHHQLFVRRDSDHVHPRRAVEHEKVVRQLCAWGNLLIDA